MGTTNLDSLTLGGDLTVSGTITGDIAATAGSIGTTELADASVTPAKLASSTAAGITTGALHYAYIAGSAIKNKLNGSPQNLISFPAGTVIVDVVFVTSTAAGSAATVNIGTDAAWSVASDADAFITAVDANAQGGERMALVDAASQAAGALGTAATGPADGNVTITASTDISGSSWNGSATIVYVPAA